MLVEIQALVAKAGFGTPQRVATGFDGRRLALLLAVLDKRAGLSFAQLDVFVNVVGGMRLQEPAGDLAVAVALASSVYDRALAARCACSPARSASAARCAPCRKPSDGIAEAANLGMQRIYLAERGVPKRVSREIEVVGVKTIGDLFTVFDDNSVSGLVTGAAKRRDVGVVIVAGGGSTRTSGRS